MSPIEVPAGNEPGALEWWSRSDESESNDEHQHQSNRHRNCSRPSQEQDQDTDLRRRMIAEQFMRNCQLFGAENVSENSGNETDDSKEEQRRAVANLIVSNMGIWGSDSDSFSDLSLEESSSSSSWVTENEEVYIGWTKEDIENNDLALNDEEEWFDPSWNVVDSSNVTDTRTKQQSLQLTNSEFVKSLENQFSSDEGWQTANEDCSACT